MPSLKRIFGSPFGSHKKRSGHTSGFVDKPKKNTSKHSIDSFSPASFPKSPSSVVKGKDQQYCNDEDELHHEATFERNYNDDDGSDFRTTIMPSIFVVAREEEYDSSRDDEDDCSRNEDERNHLPLDDEDDYDDYRTTVMPSKSKEEKEVLLLSMDKSVGDDYEEAEEVDFRTSVMPSKSTEEKECLPGDKNDDENFKGKRTGLPLDNLQVTDTVSEQTGSKTAPDQLDESPVNSVVFQKQIETGSQRSGAQPTIQTTSNFQPPSFGDSGDDDDLDFDDYRSTISGLTEATNYVSHYGDNSKISIWRTSAPPSPANTINTAGTKKMEAFLKTETEAIRQLLSTVESGDDESTVVEESHRGANEAERMAQEMEREMELLVQGHQELLTTTDDKSTKEENKSYFSSTVTSCAVDTQANKPYPKQTDEVLVSYPTMPQRSIPPEPLSMDDDLEISPESIEFLADIRSVIHPRAGNNPDQSAEKDNRSAASSYTQSTQRSFCSPRRDLFSKNDSLYDLKQRKRTKEKAKHIKSSSINKYVLYVIVLPTIIFFAGLVVNWQIHFADKDFSRAVKGTISGLKSQIIDPVNREKNIVLMTQTASATASFMKVCAAKLITTNTRLFRILERTKVYAGEQLEYCGQMFNRTNNETVESLSRTTVFVIREATHYTPLLATKILICTRETTAFLLNQLYYCVWTPKTKLRIIECLRATLQYVRDRLEYAFTDRAAREEKIREELRLQELLAAAAEAAAKEGAEKQQQLWTQTMFAGACAFVGSVATNYLWSAL